MKRIALAISMIAILACPVITAAARAQEYTTKGIMEIGGSLAGSITVQENLQQYSLDLSPSFNYFVINRVHVGIRPLYRYNLNYASVTGSYDSSYEIIPFVMAGYTLPLAEKLFLDIAPQFGYHFSSNTDINNMYLYYGLTCSLKYDFGRSLLHVNLEQYYRDRISKEGLDNIYKMALGVGWSFYF